MSAAVTPVTRRPGGASSAVYQALEPDSPWRLLVSGRVVASAQGEPPCCCPCTSPQVAPLFGVSFSPWQSHTLPLLSCKALYNLLQLTKPGHFHPPRDKQEAKVWRDKGATPRHREMAPRPRGTQAS